MHIGLTSYKCKVYSYTSASQDAVCYKEMYTKFTSLLRVFYYAAALKKLAPSPQYTMLDLLYKLARL